MSLFFSLFLSFLSLFLVAFLLVLHMNTQPPKSDVFVSEMGFTIVNKKLGLPYLFCVAQLYWVSPSLQSKT